MPSFSRDYSLTGGEARRAVEIGLANAEWYRPEIPRRRIKDLMKRRNGPAMRDTIAWFVLLAATGYGGYLFWGSWGSVPFFVFYGVLYGSASDSRWHECGHGTAFATRWMNDFIYQIASFMMVREPTIWRWSHPRHHTDTLIVGRDPEIVTTRPPNILAVLLDLFGLISVPRTLRKLVIHAGGYLEAGEKSFVPEGEWGRIVVEARILLAIHAGLFALALYLRSWLPLMYVGLLPSMYGAWLGHLFSLTQHAGLAENVLDHRLNSRTVHMNPVFRFLYWNMNYHVEHHMFPMVPYHALPRLHEIVRSDLPKPCAGTIEAFSEIISTLVHQLKEPRWSVWRALPGSARPYQPGPYSDAIPGPQGSAFAGGR